MIAPAISALPSSMFRAIAVSSPTVPRLTRLLSAADEHSLRSFSERWKHHRKYGASSRALEQKLALMLAHDCLLYEPSSRRPHHRVWAGKARVHGSLTRVRPGQCQPIATPNSESTLNKPHSYRPFSGVFWGSFYSAGAPLLMATPSRAGRACLMPRGSWPAWPVRS